MTQPTLEWRATETTEQHGRKPWSAPTLRRSDLADTNGKPFIGAETNVTTGNS